MVKQIILFFGFWVGVVSSTIDVFAFQVLDKKPTSNFSTSDGIVCDEEPKLTNEVKIFTDGTNRFIQTNSVPDHPIGKFPNRDNPHTMREYKKTYKVPQNPQKTGKLISVYSKEGFGRGTPQYEFGVAINGVVMEPSAMEGFENPNTGERNFAWVKEVLSTNVRLGDDCNNAHVQPTGKYHYHGTPHGIVNKADGKSMFLVGWAADGFPIYYKYAYQYASDKNSPIVEMKSSYKLREGKRPGNGITEPNGTYDGTYVRDFEYMKDLGDLDEANGRYGITPDFPKGIYYYVITDDFPSIPRYFVGTPSEDFKIPMEMPMGRKGMGGRERPPFGKDGDDRNNRKPPSFQELLKHMDRNKDGKLSKDEVKGPLKNDFDRVDRNKDGYLTEDELKPPKR